MCGGTHEDDRLDRLRPDAPGDVRTMGFECDRSPVVHPTVPVPTGALDEVVARVRSLKDRAMIGHADTLRRASSVRYRWHEMAEHG